MQAAGIRDREKRRSVFLSFFYEDEIESFSKSSYMCAMYTHSDIEASGDEEAEEDRERRE